MILKTKNPLYTICQYCGKIVYERKKYCKTCTPKIELLKRLINKQSIIHLGVASNK